MTIFVTGHSNPDTDSVTAAIGLAALLNAQGKDAKACMQSSLENLNPESTVVLERFGLTAPEEMMDVAGKTVALVDFSDIGQAP
ncbi:MAG TPA: manganese-dependent inorganic pyrophosphatase, partial [Desulfobacterales bacterium]|nr:manganese-dependent inorganic pyrophosphatase [Desulfobacterales bacterium]